MNPNQEGRSAFLFDDDDSDNEANESEHSPRSPSYFELQSALSRSNSELEEQEAANSWKQLEALAREDIMAEKEPAEGDGGKGSAAGSSKISAEAINALIGIVKQKMDQKILVFHDQFAGLKLELFL